VENYDIMNISIAIKNFEEEPLSLQIIMALLKDYKRPHDKIHELVKKGELILIKNGLYIPGPKLNVSRPESVLLANHIWGPSYVTLETALSHWGFIPERVYEISSATIKKAKKYKTPVGRFSYYHLPLPYYAFDIKSIELTSKQTALMASPEKALCDKIILTSGIRLRSTKQVTEFLIEDMRMDEEALKNLDTTKMKSWLADAPKASSINELIKTISSL
jgi:hypothetical protein